MRTFPEEIKGDGEGERTQYFVCESQTHVHKSVVIYSIEADGIKGSKG